MCLDRGTGIEINNSDDVVYAGGGSLLRDDD